jgi:hypothetical protein
MQRFLEMLLQNIYEATLETTGVRGKDCKTGAFLPPVRKEQFVFLSGQSFENRARWLFTITGNPQD